MKINPLKIKDIPQIFSSKYSNFKETLSSDILTDPQVKNILVNYNARNLKQGTDWRNYYTKKINKIIRKLLHKMEHY